jgi:hypothetical protein
MNKKLLSLWGSLVVCVQTFNKLKVISNFLKIKPYKYRIRSDKYVNKKPSIRKAIYLIVFDVISLII